VRRAATQPVKVRMAVVMVGNEGVRVPLQTKTGLMAFSVLLSVR